jgi:hypothetical protein
MTSAITLCIDLTQFSATELLSLHARVADALRYRGITRSSNNPTGDLAEHLFCEAFGWQRENNSNAHFDAIAANGEKYQIKGRRMTRHNKSRQLGAIRDFQGRHFEFLAGVIFSEDYAVQRAALIPYAVVEARAKFIAHTNSHKFLLHEDVWKADGVFDVTEKLRFVRL